MPRYDIFNLVHKGLRAMLYDTAIALQQTDFIDAEEAAPTLAAMDLVLNCFHLHATQEQHFVLPVIRRLDPQLAGEIEEEHVMEQSLSHRLVNMIPVYHRSVSGDARQEVGSALLKAFNEFVAFNLCHMNREEDKINRVLWAHYTDEEILEAHRCILAELPGTATDYETRCMVKGISNREIVRWLKVVENTAPELVFRELLALTEHELTESRWGHIKESLIEGAMIA